MTDHSAAPAIELARTDRQIQDCFATMVQLRTHLAAGDFVTRVRRMEGEGYQLAALRVGARVEAVAGFRVFENLHTGRLLYVDDLVTSTDARSRGHGARLLEWLARYAVEQGCVAIELDSGTQRHQAHRFYFREGMHIANYHFTRSLAEGAS